MATVVFHYWAGAKAAAGVAGETVEARTVAQALSQVTSRRPDSRFRRVVRASTVLVEGVAVRGAELERVLEGRVEVEILPPFAGG